MDSNCGENLGAGEHMKYVKNAVVQLEFYFINLKKKINTHKAEHLINYLPIQTKNNIFTKKKSLFFECSKSLSLEL